MGNQPSDEQLLDRQPSSKQLSDYKNGAAQRWVFVIKVLNQPGTLSASAAVFSNRGVSLEGILGSGIHGDKVEDGRILFCFWATAEKKALLQRSLERLPSIRHVAAYLYEDERIRAIAVVKLSPAADWQSVVADFEATAQPRIEEMEKHAEYTLLLLNGGPKEVRAAVDHFREHQTLLDVLMSVITV